MCTTSRIKAVFFDLDDTLVATSDHDARAFTAAVALASSLSKDVVINEERLLADFLSEFRRVPWDPENEIEVSSWRARLWELALRKQKASNADFLGVSLQAGEATFDRVRLERFSFIPEVYGVLKYLKEHDISPVIITNGHFKVQRDKLKACNASAHFLGNHIIVGGEETLCGREEKPAAEIFFKACQLVCCEPHEAIHVGDSLATDIQGGINAGLRATVLINPSEKKHEQGSPRPTFEAKTVGDIPAIINALLAEKC